MASTLLIITIHFLLVIVSIFSVLLATIPVSNGHREKSEYYTICKDKLFSCGNITNVDYPFWGAQRPKFCGHQNFGLTCIPGQSDGRLFPSFITYITHMGTTNGDEPLYPMITNIDKSSHTMSLVQNPYPYKINSCQSIIRNETIINLARPFQLTPLVTNISLFYGCNNTSTSAINYGGSYSNNQTCSNVSIILDSAHYPSKAADVRKASELCSTRRVILVMKSVLDELNKGNMSPTQALKKGFEVKYKAEFDYLCSKCNDTGGVCGSTNDTSMDFICYCPDKPRRPGPCPKPEETLQRALVVIEAVSGFLGLTILGLVSLVIFSKRQLLLNKFSTLEVIATRENQNNVEAFLKAYGSLAPERYRYASIKKIANSFKEKLGEGGFGSVYKGKLQDGRLVAVKLLNTMKGSGEDFLNEVLSISRTNHVNVVTLLGFCLEGNKRALIYEYLANGSLDKFICGRNTHPSLPWETLFKVAVGIARGLNYLHTGCNARILHFDIKPHNVLLDEEFCPKISDFGLAKLCPTKDSTISMLEARGTIGYIAPEFVYRDIGSVSHKSDVYSYGMMVIDMACGRRDLSREAERSSGSEVYFSEWIFNQLEQREVVTDQAMLNEEEKAVQRKMILVSLWCIQKYPSDRPSMSRVLEMIEGPLESLPVPSRESTVYI